MSPPTHPLIQQLGRSFTRTADGTVGVPHSALVRLATLASEIATGRELFELLGELVKVASVLIRELGSPDAAQGVLAVADSLAPELKRLAIKEGEALGGRAEALEGQIMAQRQQLQPTGPEAASPKRPLSGVSLRRQQDMIKK